MKISNVSKIGLISLGSIIMILGWSLYHFTDLPSIETLKVFALGALFTGGGLFLDYEKRLLKIA